VVATRAGVARPADFTRMIVDTTMKEKAITFPTDARLVHRARKHGIALRQSYARIGKGKAQKPCEFGGKVSIATTLRHFKGGQFVAHVKALPSASDDGHMLFGCLSSSSCSM